MLTLLTLKKKKNLNIKPNNPS